MGLSPPWAGVVVSVCCLGRLGFPLTGEGTVKPGDPLKAWAVFQKLRCFLRKCKKGPSLSPEQMPREFHKGAPGAAADPRAGQVCAQALGKTCPDEHRLISC